MNDIHNSSGKLLDLVFVNDRDDCLVTRADPITLPEDLYHPTIKISCTLVLDRIPEKLDIIEQTFCFKQTNYVELNNLISNTNWNDLLCFCDGSSRDPIEQTIAVVTQVPILIPIIIG